MNAAAHKFVKLFSLAGVFLALATQAFASPIPVTLTLSGVSSGVGPVTGTVTIDDNSADTNVNSGFGTILSADITVDGLTFTDVYGQIYNSGPELGVGYVGGPGGDTLGQVLLYYDTGNLGTGNLDICLATGPACGSSPTATGTQTSFVDIYSPSADAGQYDLTGGTLAQTPEPSSLLLLATGLLGVGFVLRGRRPAAPGSPV